MLEETPKLKEPIPFEDPSFPFLLKSQHLNASYDPRDSTGIFHEELEIKLITSGSATLMINGTLYDVGPGDVVVVNPYEYHYTVYTGETPMYCCLAMLSLDFLKQNDPRTPDLRFKLLGRRLCFQNVIRGDERLRQILTAAAREEAEREEGWQLVITCQMTEFFEILFRRYVDRDRLNNVQIASIRYYESILPALDSISANYAGRISVDELAALCRLSKYYFCRLFKQVTGQTVVAYVNRYRLKLADYLLRNRDATVSEIAQRCGFPDVNYFYRVYKKEFGRTCRNR